MSSTNNIFTAGIVRLIVLLVFAFALIWLFKNEISRTMERGCFSLSLNLADTGFELSDQKLCTSEDLEQAAESLVNLGAENISNEAEKVFKEYDAQINELVNKNNQLAVQLNRYASAREQDLSKSKDFSNYLTQLQRRTNNALLPQIREQFSKTFGVDFEMIAPQKVAVIDPTEVTKSTILIRSDFVKKSKSTTKIINDNLKVKK